MLGFIGQDANETMVKIECGARRPGSGPASARLTPAVKKQLPNAGCVSGSVAGRRTPRLKTSQALFRRDSHEISNSTDDGVKGSPGLRRGLRGDTCMEVTCCCWVVGKGGGGARSIEETLAEPIPGGPVPPAAISSDTDPAWPPTQAYSTEPHSRRSSPATETQRRTIHSQAVPQPQAA